MDNYSIILIQHNGMDPIKLNNLVHFFVLEFFHTRCDCYIIVTLRSRTLLIPSLNCTNHFHHQYRHQAHLICSLSTNYVSSYLIGWNLNIHHREYLKLRLIVYYIHLFDSIAVWILFFYTHILRSILCSWTSVSKTSTSIFISWLLETLRLSRAGSFRRLSW